MSKQLILCDHDPVRLSRLAKEASGDNVLPVRTYSYRNKDGTDNDKTAIIGSPVPEQIKELGTQVSTASIDFLSIALAITAADTFVQRSKATDGWTRRLSVQVPLCEPERWNKVKTDLEQALHFLSGDIWRLTFTSGGYKPPFPRTYRRGEGFVQKKLRGINCVCLFSGGLDSAIGAIDLLSTEGENIPLLVSHAYKGDAGHQDDIASVLGTKGYARFAANVHPVSVDGETELSMRTRSIGFLALSAVAASAVCSVNKLDRISLLVPENGFISLNAPLTPRRIGSLSTRTTHPYFISLIQKIFNAIGIPCEIINPYQLLTKGEMISQCTDRILLSQIVDKTVSCSHWKRTGKQCGYCVPCLIRRSAIHAGNLNENISYERGDLSGVLTEDSRKDDLFAILTAISRWHSNTSIGAWIANSGPLPEEHFSQYKDLFVRGLSEVERFLQSEGVSR